MYGIKGRIDTALWALARLFRECSCPSCGFRETVLLHRKKALLGLRECPRCEIRFRTPKDTQDECDAFYQEEYENPGTTDCPADSELRAMKSAGGAWPVDYAPYIQVLKVMGVRTGAAILDFGCSWGYGSWQLRKSGFDVYSYEVSRSRAGFAAESLGCKLVDVTECTQMFDCFFSRHVIEHLADPNLMWKLAARTVVPGGWLACFCPNGNPPLEGAKGRRKYDEAWSRVHPLLLTPEYLRRTAREYGFVPHVYTNPYHLERVANRVDDPELLGVEQALIAQKC